MTDKLIKTMAGAGAFTPAGATKPVPMKFFATWEVDRTPSNCIPRLCSLTLSRLIVFRPLGSDLASISIAVKMQSSKRTLRSNEIILPPNGLLDTGLEMTFSLQYPHFLKRDGNRLHILLQRRKRYKNRTMLGYKTLAEGIIRMDQVLQKQMDMELELVIDGGGGGSKDKGSGAQTVAKLTVLQLSSTPVDQELQKGSNRGVTEFSDEEDDPEFSSGEEAELSDSEPLRTKLPHARHNLKQRFVSLLRRFRVPDTEASRAALGASLGNTSDIQALFHELESLSCDDDSAGEQDTMSVSSTPKPSLRPFFSSSRSLLDTSVNAPNTEPVNMSQTPLVGDAGPRNSITEVPDRHDDKEKNSGSDGNADLCLTDYEAQSDPQTGSPPREKDSAADRDRKSRLFRSSGMGSSSKKKHSLGQETNMAESTAPRKSFIEQVSRVLPVEDNFLPDSVVLISGAEAQTQMLVTRLMTQYRVLQPVTAAEVKAVLNAIFNKIYKHGCNSSAKPPSPIKLVLVGGDFIVSSSLRQYVELLASRPPEWQNYIRFYIIPLGNNGIARYLCSVDSLYGSLFPPESEIKSDELITRMQRYVASTTAPSVQLPIAEAMLTCHDESSQIFIPFISEVRVGPTDGGISLSVDLDETTAGGPLLSSSPPAPPLTPPSSPNVQNRELPWEPLELQLDYWQTPKPGEVTKAESGKSGKIDGKCSLKGVFRSLHVSRLPTSGYTMCPANFSLTMNYTTKEKKQKIMRLGKKKEKEKDSDGRSQVVEGVSRLICSVKTSHSTPMRVVIDGTDWTGVKFFQLSSTWQTHIKYFTVSLVGVPLATSELS